jgi:formamidopyrimidine-DNA glycosylase
LKYYKDKSDATGHAKLIIDFANGYHLSYDNQRRLGRIDLTESIDDFVEEQELGPDVMSNDFDQDRFLETLDGRRGTIKGALMNQSIMAGVGNIYSDEALFQAEIYPGREVPNVGSEQRKKLYRTLRRVLAVAIDKQVDPSRFPRGYLLPNRRPGAECPRCGGTIRKATISGRSAYYCARHQRK